MEVLMTALHIDSNHSTEKEQTDTNTKNKKQKERLPKEKPKNRTSMTKQILSKGVQQPNETPSSPKGKLKVKRVTLKRHKESSRNYYCSLCDDNTPYKGVHKLNEHHRKMHNPVQCGVCSKWCTTPENLRRHSYSHFE